MKSLILALVFVPIFSVAPTAPAIEGGVVSTPVPKPIVKLVQTNLKPQQTLDAIQVAPAPAPAPAPPPVVVQGGCGSDPYMAQIYMRESGCRVDAVNPSSGAYGLCQSLPGYKMATVGADWATSWATQNAWCIGYADARYGSPAGAWAAWQIQGWW